MGTNVAHSRDRTLRRLADQDWETQENGPFEAAGSEFTAEAGGIPKTEQWRTLGWLNFGDEVAIHGKREDVRERTSLDCSSSLIVNIASGSWNVKPTGLKLHLHPPNPERAETELVPGEHCFIASTLSARRAPGRSFPLP